MYIPGVKTCYGLYGQNPRSLLLSSYPVEDNSNIWKYRLWNFKQTSTYKVVVYLYAGK